MTTPADGVKAVFDQAAEIATPADRAAFLDHACGGDMELRARVEALLRAHAEAGSFLEQPAVTPAKTANFAPGGGADKTAAQTPQLSVGTVIGPYKLLQQIGEGGMGTVFMAEQTQPIQRKVAIKVIKPGMDSRQVIARFEAERQALALMDHVNIARVLDVGATESGRPYFVMELVQGVPITKYCDDNHLTPRERLELFVPVCQAIQHAHQKGIIHRDIKPSNVMVTLYDGRPVPKVIDFGVAKATEQRLTERTLFTQHGTMVGTLEYMSPEQAEMSALGVDTRSDIYSLGVLLYELLTGSTPLTHKRMKDAAYAEILRMIKEEEPQKPSTRLSDSGEALASISANRHTEPARLTKLVRGELDWIVLKTLEKDRNRRYETANGFAADVQRYLNDEAVQACPPSATYRLRKFVRRNKAPVLAGAAIVLLLVGGIVGTALGMMRADRARQAEADRAEGERQAKELAQKRLDQIEKANEILASVFHNMDPKAEEKGGPTLRVQLGERLDQAAKLLEGEAIGDPVTVARLQDLLGSSLLSLGYHDKAQQLLEKARQTRTTTLGQDHPDTLTTKNNLALLYRAQGNYASAELLYLEVLQARTAKLGADDSDTLLSKNNLALLYESESKYDRAEPFYLEVLQARTARLGADHPNTLMTKDNLAVLYRIQGKYDRSETLHLEVLQARTAKLGADHPDTLMSRNNLAWLYTAQGKYDRAEPIYLEVLLARTAKLGADHPDTLRTKINLGQLYVELKKYDLAESLFKEVLQASASKLGADHPNTLTTKNNLASLYTAQEKYDLAEPLFREVLQAQTVKLGADHPNNQSTKNNLALLYQRQQKYDLAEPLFQEVLQAFTAKLGADHASTLTSKSNLAALYSDQGRHDAADPLFREAVAGARQKLGLAHPNTQTYIRHLIGCCEKRGQPAEAEPLCRELAEFWRQKSGADSPQYAGHLALLGQNLLTQKKPAEAERVLRDCLAIRDKKEPDAWTTFSTKASLGRGLAGQQKYAEAEPLLLQGYEGMKQRQAKMPKEAMNRLIEALTQLVQLYDAWGKPDQAAMWRKKLEAPKQNGREQETGKKD